ncbi:MAG TPA: hypothetical protein VJ895_01055 [Candidatus Nanoarchaeia archaeon]|nr:hypothetical protein [Candidatus Nanoarchaeia archaeon]
MKLEKKPVEERKSFIRAISPKDNLTSRIMTAVITGQISGQLFGAYMPWLIVGFDGLIRKKPFSWTNLRDYAIYKTSAALMNPQEIESTWNFAKEKYQIFEPYLENILTNYF